MSGALRLVGGEVLLPGDGLVETPVTIANGVFGEGPGTELDVSGHLVLPGIIDLHGDGFERQLEPRRGAFFPFPMGLAATDAEMAANGVTTAWLAQSFSWEGMKRGPEFAGELIAALRDLRPRLRTDLRIQLRFENHLVDAADALLGHVAAGDVDYVVFNDHLPEADERLENDPQSLAVWAAGSGRTPEEHMALVRATQARAAEVPGVMARIAAELAARGVPFGSHDDATAERRQDYHALGARICEFPITRVAAETARALGDPILMGAPNVVRGGSASGNVNAVDLIGAGLCDVLVSDYHTPALAAAAWRLVDDGVLPFAEAWAMISTNAAAALRLTDRGRIAPGYRADLAIIDAGTRRVEATVSGGRIAHLSGALAARWQGADAGAAYRAAE